MFANFSNDPDMIIWQVDMWEINPGTYARGERVNHFTIAESVISFGIQTKKNFRHHIGE